MRTKKIGQMPTPEQFAEFFKEHLLAFNQNNPFVRPDQLSNHRRTIQLRYRLGSASTAIESTEFLTLLYDTLHSWGIGLRQSRLLPLKDFCEALRSKKEEIQSLDSIPIESSLEHGEIIWNIISALGIVRNNAPIVSGTKALHHILPELVVPIDRGYTQKLFGWQNPEFQYHQERCFLNAHRFFVKVAQLSNPSQYVSDGWFTSTTKIIDNAVVGAVRTTMARIANQAL